MASSGGAGLDAVVRELIARGEGPSIEFKLNVPEPRLLAQLLAAFANTDGGTLVVGVDDRDGGKIVGVESFRRLELAAKAAASRLSPPPRLSIDEVRIDGKVVGLVRVEKQTGLVLADAGAYAREHEFTRVMSPAQIANRLTGGTHHDRLDTLAGAISSQTITIETLREEVRRSNTWQSKSKDYFWGGVVGAVIGALATRLIG